MNELEQYICGELHRVCAIEDELNKEKALNNKINGWVREQCYECQDFNDPPYCSPDCRQWTLRFWLNVKDIDIWPEDDDCPVEESYEKAKKV